MRFDSDDINSDVRLEKQLEFLELNPQIDILGSYVLEYASSKSGNLVAARYKKIPLNNIEIGRSMSYRNPLNHPTIVFRRKSILALGSYESVDYFEDYFLWLKARQKGLVFGNLPIALVAMSRPSVTQRRKGLRYFWHELKFIILAQKRGTIGVSNLIILLIRALLRLMPLPATFLANITPWRSQSFKIKKSNILNLLR